MASFLLVCLLVFVCLLCLGLGVVLLVCLFCFCFGWVCCCSFLLCLYSHCETHITQVCQQHLLNKSIAGPNIIQLFNHMTNGIFLPNDKWLFLSCMLDCIIPGYHCYFFYQHHNTSPTDQSPLHWPGDKASTPTVEDLGFNSSSAFPSYISGLQHFGRDFGVCDLFNPTTEVVTFRLWGRCMLGVFLLPAFTHLGHECQDLLSLCSGMHMCTDLGLSSHPNDIGGNGVRTHVNSKRKIPSTTNILLREGSNPRCCIKQESKPNILPTSYSGPKPGVSSCSTVDLFAGQVISKT